MAAAGGGPGGGGGGGGGACCCGGGCGGGCCCPRATARWPMTAALAAAEGPAGVAVGAAVEEEVRVVARLLPAGMLTETGSLKWALKWSDTASHEEKSCPRKRSPLCVCLLGWWGGADG